MTVSWVVTSECRVQVPAHGESKSEKAFCHLALTRLPVHFSDISTEKGERYQSTRHSGSFTLGKLQGKVTTRLLIAHGLQHSEVPLH
jgi:hypothetical protein